MAQGVVGMTMVELVEALVDAAVAEGVGPSFCDPGEFFLRQHELRDKTVILKNELLLRINSAASGVGKVGRKI